MLTLNYNLNKILTKNIFKNNFSTGTTLNENSAACYPFSDYGYIIAYGDGVAWIYGLGDAGMGELVNFENGINESRCNIVYINDDVWSYVVLLEFLV